MDVEIQGRIGEIWGGDGIEDQLRMFRSYALVVGHGHGRYTVPGFRGRIFSAVAPANTAYAAGNLVGAAAGANVNFAIWNPRNSGVTLALLKFWYLLRSGTPPSASVFHGIYKDHGITATGTVAEANRVGTTQPKSGAYYLASAAGAALTGSPAVVNLRPAGMAHTATAQAGVTQFQGVDLGEGDIVLPPGAGWAPLFTAGGGTTPIFDLGAEWEELPITP